MAIISVEFRGDFFKLSKTVLQDIKLHVSNLQKQSRSSVSQLLETLTMKILIFRKLILVFSQKETFHFKTECNIDPINAWYLDQSSST